MAGKSTKANAKSTTGSGSSAPRATKRVQAQEQQQPQAAAAPNTTRGLGALTKREQQNLGRWIGGVAGLLGKAGIDVPLGTAA